MNLTAGLCWGGNNAELHQEAGRITRVPVFDQLPVGIAKNSDPCDRDLPSRQWDGIARLNQVPLMRASHRPARGYPLAIDQFIIYRDLEVRKRHARPSNPLLVVVAVPQLWYRLIVVGVVVCQNLIH